MTLGFAFPAICFRFIAFCRERPLRRNRVALCATFKKPDPQDCPDIDRSIRMATYPKADKRDDRFVRQVLGDNAETATVWMLIWTALGLLVFGLASQAVLG